MHRPSLLLKPIRTAQASQDLYSDTNTQYRDTLTLSRQSLLLLYSILDGRIDGQWLFQTEVIFEEGSEANPDKGYLRQ